MTALLRHFFFVFVADLVATLYLLLRSHYECERQLSHLSRESGGYSRESREFLARIARIRREFARIARLAAGLHGAVQSQFRADRAIIELTACI